MPEFDFGHFHVLNELGRGGMALVYKAIDTRDETTIALKILYPHLMSDDNTIKRFQREAKVAQRLKHKYIVPVTDFGEHENQIYIAMKYMSGNSLAEMFIEPRKIQLKHVIRLLGEVASALDFAHGKGVIHRDLKLQNILLDEDKHAYLSDFGIARLVDGTRLTATGQIAGTPMYMSPEQIRGKPVDFRSDIYSFSVMAYLMLTGFYPFTGEDSLSIIHKHVKEYPPLPTDVNNDLPEEVNSILLRGLMKDPKDRYDSTLDMVKALHRAITAVPDYHETTTNVNIHGINPVDSVEMDAVPLMPDSRVQSATGETSAHVASQADVSSGNITAQQTMQSNGSRLGIFGLVFGLVAVSAVVILLLFLASQNNSNADQVNIASTQARREVELDLTATALGHEASESEEDEEREHALETQSASSTLTQASAPTETLTSTPTITLTPTHTITPTPTQVDFPGSNGIIVSTSGAQLVTAPGPNGEPITTLPDGLPIRIVGRTGMGDYFDIETVDGLRGYVIETLIETDLDICEQPNTYFPENPPPSRPDGERRPGQCTPPEPPSRGN